MTARRVFAGSVTHAGPCGYKSSENAQTLSTRQICRAVPQAEAHSLQRMRQLSRGTALHSRWAAWSTTRCRAGPSSPARRKGKKVVFSIARACTNKRTCRSIPTPKKNLLCTYEASTLHRPIYHFSIAAAQPAANPQTACVLPHRMRPYQLTKRAASKDQGTVLHYLRRRCRHVLLHCRRRRSNRHWNPHARRKMAVAPMEAIGFSRPRTLARGQKHWPPFVSLNLGHERWSSRCTHLIRLGEASAAALQTQAGQCKRAMEDLRGQPSRPP